MVHGTCANNFTCYNRLKHVMLKFEMKYILSVVHVVILSNLTFKPSDVTKVKCDQCCIS